MHGGKVITEVGMDKSIVRQYRRNRVHLRTSRKVFGTEVRPRLAVFRSNKHFYAQAIDDLKGITLAAASTLEEDFRTKMPELDKQSSPKAVAAAEAEEKPVEEKKGQKKAEPKAAPKKSRGVLTAELLGRYMAQKVKAKGIDKVVFDRGGFLYHGQIRASDDGARQAGLSF